MTLRVRKILAVGLVIGGVIYFVPQAIESCASAANFARRLGWAARTPYWGFVQIGALRSRDIWLLVIAALISAGTGGAFGELVCIVGAMSKRLEYRITAFFALIATSCFIWAPYQM